MIEGELLFMTAWIRVWFGGELDEILDGARRRATLAHAVTSCGAPA